MIPLLELAEKRALVVAPHADDEVLGAGGLIARATRAGWETHVLYTTVSGYFSAARAEDSRTEGRLAEVRAALKVLGVTGFEALFVGEENHLRLDAVPQIEMIRFIEKWVLKIRPSLVVLPCRGHFHQDHRAVADAGVAALRPAPNGPHPFVPIVLAYGHAGAGWGDLHHSFHPNLFVDITDALDVKMEALKCYESQICPSPHARSLDAVKNWSAAWGILAGVQHAEPFECLRLAVN